MVVNVVLRIMLRMGFLIDIFECNICLGAWCCGVNVGGAGGAEGWKDAPVHRYSNPAEGDSM